MIQQHCYGSVPARANLYLHTDGYGTYSISKGISQELIEKELKPCMFSLSRYDIKCLSAGFERTVYTSYLSSDGSYRINSVFHLASKDYTGEKPGYYVQSLLIPAADMRRIVSDASNLFFDYALFSPWKGADRAIDSPAQAKDLVLTVKRLNRAEDWHESFSRYMLEKLLYAIVRYVGTSKEIYIVPTRNAEESDGNSESGQDELYFLNRLLSVLPAYVKRRVTFTTGVFSNHKLKPCQIKLIPRDYLEKQGEIKGFVFDFVKGKCEGIDSEEFKSETKYIQFLYSLYSDEAMLHSFFDFCSNITENDPQYEKYSFKSFKNLIDLFRAIHSDNDTARSRLADEEILKNLTTYADCKGNISPTDCVRVYDSLIPYTSGSRALSEKNYQFLVKNYSEESAECKNRILEILLRLYSSGLYCKSTLSLVQERVDSVPNELCFKAVQTFLSARSLSEHQRSVEAVLTKLFGIGGNDAKKVILDYYLKSIRSGEYSSAGEFFKTAAPLLTSDDMSYMLRTAKNKIPLVKTEGSCAGAIITAELYANLKPQPKQVVYDEFYRILDRESKKGNLTLLADARRSCAGLYEQLSCYCIHKWTSRRCWPGILSDYLSGNGETICNRLSSISDLFPTFTDDMRKYMLSALQTSVKKALKDMTADEICDFDKTICDILSQYGSAYVVVYSDIKTKAIVPAFISRVSVLLANGEQLSEKAIRFADQNELREHPVFEVQRKVTEISDQLKRGEWKKAWERLVLLEKKILTNCANVLISAVSDSGNEFVGLAQKKLMIECISSYTGGKFDYTAAVCTCFGDDAILPENLEAILELYCILSSADDASVAFPKEVVARITPEVKKQYSAQYGRLYEVYSPKIPKCAQDLENLKSNMGFFRKLFANPSHK